MNLTTANPEEVRKHHDAAVKRMDTLRGRNLSLDMTRGKPSPEQLDLSEAMLTIVRPGDTTGEDGTDLGRRRINQLAENSRFLRQGLCDLGVTCGP